MVFSWLGKQHQTTLALESLWYFLDGYGPQVAPFYGLSVAEVRERLARLRDRAALGAVLASMNAKAGILHEVAWLDGTPHATLRVTPHAQRLQHELEVLQSHHVSVLISLLEQPLDQTALAPHFTVYHLPVADVTPPSREQVYAYAHMLRTALEAGQTVVTHCLAGVGRTTTMLIAASLVYGYRLPELAAWVHTCNPHFQFKGRQAVFLQELADDLASGRLPRLSAGKEALPGWVSRR